MREGEAFRGKEGTAATPQQELRAAARRKLRTLAASRIPSSSGVRSTLICGWRR
jgi:hypothetical protein